MGRVNRRGALPALLTVAVVVLAVAGLALAIRADRSRDDAASVRDLARRVSLPAGSTPFTGVMAGCPAAEYFHCARTDLDVDTAARQLRGALGVVAEAEPTLRCQTLPPGPAGAAIRSCQVQVRRGSHAVTIFVDPQGHRAGGRWVITGSEITVDAG